MASGTGNTQHRGWHALTICTLAAMLGAIPWSAASVEVAEAPTGGLVGARFSEDCVSVAVESSREVKSIVAVFNNDTWEQIDGQSGFLSYVVKVGPNASKSGLAIATLYVDASSRLRKDPLGIVPHKVGVGFKCARKSARTAERSRW